MKNLTKNLKKTSAFLLIILFCFTHLIMAVGQVADVTIGTDAREDIRKFPLTWLNSTLQESVADWNDLDDVYNTLNTNWENPDACSPPTPEEYTANNYIDITTVKVVNLTLANASMVVEVVGNPSTAPQPILLFVWSNCSPNNAAMNFIGIYYPAGLGGDEISIYMGIYGDLNVSGEVDVNASGLSLEFPSAWWEDSSSCQLKVMMLTTDDYTNPSYYYIDIFPGTATPFFSTWLGMLLLLLFIILLIILFLLYLYYRNKKKNKKTRNKKKVKR